MAELTPIEIIRQALAGKSSGVSWGIQVTAARLALVEVEAVVAAGLQAMNGQHVVKVGETGWSLRHPIGCRPDLLGCAVHLAAETYPHWEFEQEVGFYLVAQLDGVIAFESERLQDEPVDEVIAIRAALVPFGKERP